MALFDAIRLNAVQTQLNLKRKALASLEKQARILRQEIDDLEKASSKELALKRDYDNALRKLNEYREEQKKERERDRRRR